LLLLLPVQAVQWKYFRVKESIDSRIIFYTICVPRNLRAAWLPVYCVFDQSAVSFKCRNGIRRVSCLLDESGICV